MTVTGKQKPTPQERLRRIREQIATIEVVCSGTLLHRTKMCGRSYCACATDPKARHGPYFEWNRTEGDRRVHTAVNPALAQAIAKGIRNHRRLRRLMRVWERESIRVLIEEEKAKSQL